MDKLPDNPTIEEFNDLRQAFHYALKVTRCSLPSFVHKYISWLEKLAKAGIPT